MKLCVPSPKYFVCAGNRAHTVMPFFLGFFASRQWNTADDGSSRLMPRCFSYHSYSHCGFWDLKKMPPMPVTRFMVPPPCDVKSAESVLQKEPAGYPGRNFIFRRIQAIFSPF